jgi:hypothetical protein
MRSIITAFGIVTILMTGNAVASPVTVTGGFTSFDGLVAGNITGITQTLNGVPLCADAGCSFTDNAHVDFALTGTVEFQSQSPSPNPINIISFTPAATQDVSTTVPTNTFLLGSILFQNGIWSGGNASFGFTLTTHSPNSALNNQTFTDILHYTLTPNDFVNHTPNQNADFISFTGNPLLGSGRAYELNDTPDSVNLNKVKFDVFGRITSLHLDLTSFANPVGGFLDPGVGLQPTNVPEPSTLLLFGLSLVGLVAWRWKRAA